MWTSDRQARSCLFPFWNLNALWRDIDLCQNMKLSAFMRLRWTWTTSQNKKIINKTSATYIAWERERAFARICDIISVYSSSSSPSPAAIRALTSFHNFPLLWFSYHEVIAVSNTVWKTKAPAKIVPTKTAFRLKKVLYSDEKDYS